MDKSRNVFDLPGLAHSTVYEFCSIVYIDSFGEARGVGIFICIGRNYTGMERMNVSIHKLLVIALTVLIFIIPFFWLKPGEMDLGGDNSRLYFYDPIAYLVSQSLYSISHSGFGGENLSYFGIPFFLLLAGVKWLVTSPTILIGIFHGLNLSGGFISCYFVVKELLKNEESSSHERLTIEASAVLAGLYYTFSPNPIGGWGYPLLPMNLVFLNPLLFYLLLRFFLTGSMRYIFISLLITFLFSPNFSFIGAPTFFSFFPLAVLFLMIYTKVCKKLPIPWAKIVLSLILFVLIQAFHLFPQVVSIMTPGSVANETVFGNFGKFEWGLKYFLGTASIIKVSNSIFGLPQFGSHEIYYPLYAIFPLLMVIGLWKNNRRLWLLGAIFFLLALFLVTANITNIGFKLYVLAFRLPGFSMFRVFYGQWQWTYLFFYTMFLGLSLAAVLPKIKKGHMYALVGSMVLLLVVTAWPLITGALTDTKHWQSNDIRSHVEMDPEYEQVLGFIRTLPVDGKIITFPLSGPGYQVLKGINDAAYEGPSTITYLAARNEFNGFGEFGVYSPSLLAAARKRDYKAFKEILAILNIKYIFYNEDPYIYTDNYPAMPYEQVRDFFPDTQEGYKEFIQGLGVRELKSFGWKYHIYELDNATYVPHIYISPKRSFWNDVIVANIHGPFSFYEWDNRVALYDDKTSFNKFESTYNDIFVKAKNTSILFDFFKKKKEDKFVSPTISQKLNSFIYPLVIIKEARDLARFTTVNDAYIDRSIYFAEKRVNELVRLEHIPLLKNVVSITKLSDVWKEPNLLEWRRFAEYNSWEITLVRYKRAIEKLIDALEKSNHSSYSVTTEKVELKNYLMKHKDELRSAVRKETLWATNERIYVSELIEQMYEDLLDRLSLRIPDISTVSYNLDYPIKNGLYEFYLHKDDVRGLDQSLVVNGAAIESKKSDHAGWIRYDDVIISNDDVPSINLFIKNNFNLVEAGPWKAAEQIVLKDPVTLSITHDFLGDTSGLVHDISQWEGETIYVIAFDYITYGQNFSVSIFEQGGTKSKKLNNVLYEETLRSRDWKSYSTAVLSSKNAQSAYLHIVKNLDDYELPDISSVKKISIRNLSVRKFYNPKIVLKKTDQATWNQIPNVTFRQINPTKYEVRVQNASGPYTLVLSQYFNQKWKIFFPNQENQAKSIKGAIVRLVGNIFGKVFEQISLRVNSNSTDGIISYANEGVQEGPHDSIVLDKDTFASWGQDPIGEATHLPVNGYANSWYIEPKDVQFRTDYTLIVEMTSQKLFYVGVLLSIGGLLLVIFLLAKSFIVIRR